MKLRIVFLLIAVVLCALPLSAQNLDVHGPHYNLNIIGVENPKTADMRDTGRHTIFVGLGKKDGNTVTTNIYLVPGEDFYVCDGNGFDDAVDCEGNYKGTGAVFQLPCNTNVSNDVEIVPCDVPEAQKTSYTVWVRALGMPGGMATITTCATDTYDSTVVCSTESAIVMRPSNPNGNKPGWQNVTDELTSLVTCYDPDTGNYGPEACSADNAITVRVELFASDLVDWFWKYENKGLRLAQVRFYLTN